MIIGYILGLLLVFVSWFDGFGFLLYVVLCFGGIGLIAVSVHAYAHFRRKKNPKLWGKVVRFRESRWPRVRRWQIRGLWICGTVACVKFMILAVDSWSEEVTVWPVGTGSDLRIEKTSSEAAYYALTLSYTIISILILILCGIALLEKIVLSKNRATASVPKV